MKVKQILTLLISSLCIASASAQEIEMADDFRGEGKIYVVVAVVVALILGVFVQLWRLDKKIKVLEKENKSE
jgi:ABC-type amino acid transport system permease subunit